MKLRLEIEVTYENEDGSADVPEDRLAELRDYLRDIANHAANRGGFTGDSDICVDVWEARVVRLDP